MENKVLAEKFRLATGFRIDVDQLLAEPDKAATFRRVVWTMPVGVKMVYPGAYVYNIIKDCVNSFAQALGLDVESAKRALEVDGQYSVRDEVFIKMLDSEYVPGGGNNDDDEPTEVRVTAVKVQGYTVGTTLPMKPEATYQLVIEVVPENATDKTAVWTSSDESVVVVDEDGLVTAVGEGNANIVVTVGGKSKTVKFAVRYPSVESFSLSSNQIQLECGQTQQLSVIVVPEDAKYDNVQWRSSNRNVATVDENGLVTMVSNDKDASAVITATINGQSTQCTVSVIEKYIDVESVSLAGGETSFTIYTGEKKALSVVIEPSNATNKSVTWTSSNPSVATVNSNGMVTGVAEGDDVVITATVDGKSVKCSFSIKKKDIPVSSVTLSSTSATLEIGSTKKLTATVKPDNATDKSVSWSSSDDSVATVNDNGLVAAIGEGTAIITASVGEKSSSCNITVNVKQEEQPDPEVPGEKHTLLYGTIYNSNIYYPVRIGLVNEDILTNNFDSHELEFEFGKPISLTINYNTNESVNNGCTGIAVICVPTDYNIVFMSMEGEGSNQVETATTPPDNAQNVKFGDMTYNIYAIQRLEDDEEGDDLSSCTIPSQNGYSSIMILK